MSFNHLVTLNRDTFFGLDSLKELYLSGNNLTRLPADVFNHLPRPFQLTQHYPWAGNTTDNPVPCDTGLCWLKHEEQQGTITWRHRVYKPRCANGIDWDTWSCNEAGNVMKQLISSRFCGATLQYDPSKCYKSVPVYTKHQHQRSVDTAMMLVT